MYIDSLFNKLSGSSTATLILKRDADRLNYYIISGMTGHTVITVGQCDGEIENSSVNLISFNIILSAVAPLIDKGVKLRIKYSKGILEFCNHNNTIRISPVYIEAIDNIAQEKLKKFLEFEDTLKGLNSLNSLEKQIVSLETDKRDIEKEIVGLDALVDKLLEENNIKNKESDLDKLYNRSKHSYEEANRVIDLLKQKLSKINRDISTLYANKEKQKEILGDKKVSLFDLTDFRDIIDIAYKGNEVVSFCSSFVTTKLGKDCCILKKKPCITRGIHSNILNQLIKYGKDGKFYFNDKELIFIRQTESSSTVVFIDSYLPNTTIDTTLIKKGQVLEKYIVDMSVISSISPILNKFDRCWIDMNTGSINFDSDSGDTLVVKVSVKDVDSIEYRKMMSGEIKSGFKMANFYLPIRVFRLFYNLTGDLTIYIKSKKIIFQSQDIFIVIGRSDV